MPKKIRVLRFSAKMGQAPIAAIPVNFGIDDTGGNSKYGGLLTSGQTDFSDGKQFILDADTEYYLKASKPGVNEILDINVTIFYRYEI